MNGRRGEDLIIWTFATFHAATFVLIAMLLVYRGGGLGQALQGLNTAVGLGLFVALWATTYLATRQALRGLGLAVPSRIDDRAFSARAIRWGALNGVMFLAVLAAVFLGGSVISRPGDLVQALRGPTAVQSTLFLLGGLTVAGAIALFVGGLIGLAFSGIDLILLGIAARIVRNDLPR